MHALCLVTLCHLIEVLEELVGIERRNRGYEARQCLNAGVEGLISRELVLCHTTSPEAFLIQADIPVGELVHHKVLYQTTCWSHVIISKILIHVLHQRIKLREKPAVEVWTLAVVYVRLLILEAVNVGIKRKEGISLVELDEET